jgi:hypothetical protein
MQNPFTVVDRRPLYGVVKTHHEHRFRVRIPEFQHYKQDSLLTTAAQEALHEHAVAERRGLVDRDGGLTFYYNGMGQLPPAIGNGDNWYPGTAAGGFTKRPCARGSNPINRRTVAFPSHTEAAGATEPRAYLARVNRPFSAC